MSDRERNSISSHDSFGCAEPLNTTRLEPPAFDTPDGAPVGPGSGAVAHDCCISGGRRCSNSPMFQGPVIHIAKVPRANSWYGFAMSLLPATGAKPSRKSLM